MPAPPRDPYGADALGVVYGCMTVGGLDQGSAERALDAALDGGVTVFDHADIYAGGRSEEVFGQWLAARPGVRDRLVLQTKCGIRFRDDPPGAPPRYDASYEHVVASVDGSLRRLGVEAVDVLLLHRPDPLMDPGEVAHAFSTLRAAGKVRAFGVSNYSAAQVDLLAQALAAPLVANQVQLSLLHRDAIDAGVEVNRTGDDSQAAGLVDACWQRGLRVQAWSPVAGGALGRDSLEPALHPLRDLVGDLAGSYGTTPSGVLLAWLLRHPARIQPVVGTTTPDRIAAACAAAGVRLSREDWYRLFVTARGGELP